MCIPTAIVMVEYRNIEQWLANYIHWSSRACKIKMLWTCARGIRPFLSFLHYKKLLYVLKRVFRLHSIYRLFYKHKAANSSEPWLLDHTDARDRMQSDMHATLHPHWLQWKNRYNTAYSKHRKATQYPQVVVPRHHPECCPIHTHDADPGPRGVGQALRCTWKNYIPLLGMLNGRLAW